MCGIAAESGRTTSSTNQDREH
eukprot:SAG31_NODE_38521_length_295_cov_1.219388_1_plen_21_part_01